MATKQKTALKNKGSKISKSQPVPEKDSNVIGALTVAFTILCIWFATLAFVNYV